MRPLSPKQRRFATEYLKDSNGTQAAIRAGYSKKTAQVQSSNLLSKTMVQDFLASRMEKIEAKAFITVEYVVEGLKEVAERCMQRAPVMRYDPSVKGKAQVKDSEGRNVWEFDSAGANKSFELLGKHIGLFPDHHILTGKNGKPIEVKEISVPSLPPELMKKLATMAIAETNGHSAKSHGESVGETRV